MNSRIAYPALVIVSVAFSFTAHAQMSSTTTTALLSGMRGTAGSAAPGGTGLGAVGDQAGGTVGGSIDASVAQGVGGMSAGASSGGSGGGRKGVQPGATGSMLAGRIIQGGAVPGVRSDRGISTNSGLKKGISGTGSSMSGISVKGLSPAVRAALSARLAAMVATSGMGLQGGRKTNSQAPGVASMGSDLGQTDESGTSSADQGATERLGSPFEHVADPFHLGFEGFGAGSDASSLGEGDDSTEDAVADLSSRGSMRSVGTSLGSRSSLHRRMGETSAEARLKRGETRGPSLGLNR